MDRVRKEALRVMNARSSAPTHRPLGRVAVHWKTPVRDKPPLQDHGGVLEAASRCPLMVRIRLAKGDANRTFRGPGFSAAGVRLGRADVGFYVPPVGSIPEVSAHRRKLVVGGELTTCQEAVVSQQCKTILPPSAQPTVPQSPPSPPLAPFADEPCTETTQDERCKVTLKIKARLLP